MGYRHTYYTDQERYEFCRRFKVSGLSQKEFCKRNNLARATLRDWMVAYNNLTGDFIRVNTALEQEEATLTDEDVRVNLLKPEQIIKKSTHFSRFDHSIVVIEYKELKITTDVATAEKLLEGLYGKIL